MKLIVKRFFSFLLKITPPILKNPDIHILSQIQKAQSIGSVVTVISFILNVFVSRMKSLEFLLIPLIILVSLTIIGSAFYLFQTIKHKEEIENLRKNITAFVIRIVINVVLLVLMLL
ncbi:hypothetical protein LV84_00416 [Algoriphagus ratkowskyi]|uniref:Uncharacterized protein n=1 Tax=Algoriphagus ratkowskyi TaxID=57028 RepID=A0A2W7RY51_9BACT|nr:hypothetical protein [Algoriphagus ratkowskyi]PZX60147.1 hypothetical protein LV84_00416 [Algoriphagus ratkowskyi]TXD77974.1 hypothetical protein ESW18_07950 [Algoriphagus ratkowskyi]